MYKGYDISSLQSAIPFSSLAGADFLILRNYVGNDFQDNTYYKRLDECKQNNMPVASYSFLYPLVQDLTHLNRNPKDQAYLHHQHTWTSLVCADLEFPVIADWQKWNINAAYIIDWVSTYMDTYKQLSGSFPLLYTYPNYMETLGFPDSFVEYDLWLANYSNTNVPKPWIEYKILQTGQTAINGISIDTNECFDLGIFK